MRINVTPTADRPRGVKRKGEKRPAEPITPFWEVKAKHDRVT